MKQERDLSADIEILLAPTDEREVDAQVLRRRLAGEHPIDIAMALQNLDEKQKGAVFQALDAEVMAQVLDETDLETKKSFLDQADRHVLTDVLEEMPPDEGADLLDLLPEETEEQVLRSIEEPHAGSLRELLEYEPDTAGGQMTTDFVSLTAEGTAGEAIASIQGAVDAEHISWLYVVDDSGKLVGTVSIRQLVTARPETRISEFMHTQVHSVTTDVDQEEAARLVDRYNLPALPVTDGSDVLKGIITLDDVVDVIRQEVDEDMYRLAGTASDHPVTEAIPKRVLKRLPWLVVTMVTGLTVAYVYSSHEELLQGAVAVVFFAPVIQALGGSIGVQSSTILVRGLATGELQTRWIRRLLLNEMGLGAMIGVICGIVVGAVAGFWQGDPNLGFVVGGAILTGVVASSMTGILIPAACHRIGLDPAISAGPFITGLNDIIGLGIYLTFATLVLHWGS